jgi:ubiquinone biosynthesis protein UbiJ
VPAQAETRIAEDRRPELSAESRQACLDARTVDLDLAQNQTALAKLESAEQALAATTVRGEADAATSAAATSEQQAADARREAESPSLAIATFRQQTAELQPQVNLLQARITGSDFMVTFAGIALFR